MYTFNILCEIHLLDFQHVNIGVIWEQNIPMIISFSTNYIVCIHSDIALNHNHEVCLQLYSVMQGDCTALNACCNFKASYYDITLHHISMIVTNLAVIIWNVITVTKLYIASNLVVTGHIALLLGNVGIAFHAFSFTSNIQPLLLMLLINSELSFL